MAGQDPSYSKDASHLQAFVAPAVAHQAITPSDTTTYDGIRALYVGGAGTVVATMNNPLGVPTAVTYTVPAGGVLNIAATKIAAASTATLIVALF